MFISFQKLSKLFHEAFTNVTKDYSFLYYHLYYRLAIRLFCPRLCCGHFEITLRHPILFHVSVNFYQNNNKLHVNERCILFLSVDILYIMERMECMKFSN